MKAFRVYQIGTPGKAWGDEERSLWRSQQTKKRSFVTDVVTPLRAEFEKNKLLSDVAEIVEYGHLDYTKYDIGTYDLVAVKSKDWSENKFTAVVTGGVHGYETSGVHGALHFIFEKFASFSSRLNLVVLPCITPWAYETINRWNPDAVDPNRSFDAANPRCKEAGFALRLIQELGKQSKGFLVHTDLHETTDTDNSEFTPAKFARDGSEPEAWSEIPDGFYLVGDTDRPAQNEFQIAMLNAVRPITHIAPADENNCIIGEPLTKDADGKDIAGLVSIPCKNLFLCAAQTDAPFVTTTEVYPDSPKTNPEQCNKAQVACVTAGIEYALAHAPQH